MKKVYQIFSFLLSLILIFVLIPNTSMMKVNAASISSSQVVSYFESKVGIKWGQGLCLNFVRTCFQDLGEPYSSSCCAYNYGTSFLDSTSKSNIPIGADVFFSGPVKLCGVCSTCGNSAGHVGVYVGDGYIIHDYSSKIVKTTISKVEKDGYVYRGWGYHGNVTIVGENPTPHLDFSGYEPLPSGKLPQGKSYPVKGIISAYPNINHVWGGVYYRNGNATGEYCDVRIDSSTYNLADYFDSKIIFNHLEVGYYTYKIEATTTDGQHQSIQSDFQIGDPPPEKKWYETLTPADLGNFDGIILNKNYWKPIRPDDSANVVLYDEEWRTSEMWRFTRQSDGSYKIENFGNGLCLDAWGMGTANGTNVCTHESNDSMAQRWFIYAVNGGYAFRPAYGELAMDLNGNNNANTTNIHLWEYHGQDAQIFSIYNNGVSEYAKPAPNTPRVSATGETSVSIGWDAVAYVEKYVVYRSTDNSSWSKIGETTATSYTDNGLSASTKYYYKYECVNRFYTVSSSSVSATTNAKPEYTITFDANGGNCSPTSKVVRLGNVYGDLPDATKTGYTFNGWYTEKNGGSQVTKDTKMNTANNHTLYAHWTANQYIVIYDANTGTGTMDNSTITYDMESSLRKNTFTKAGYSFECWSDGNGHYYSDEANVKNLVTSGSTTLWVKWKPNQYTVKLDANGGTVSPESITVTYDGTYSNLPDPTRTGYFFNGWFPENGAQISNPDVVKITSDLTLYAHWSQERMMISFNANGGTSETKAKYVTYDNEFGVLPTATKTGYTFEGWYLDENFTTPITESSIVKITANQSVYAKWNLQKFTIKFDANGGTAETSGKQVIFSRTYGVLPVAEKENHVFVGWFTEDGKEVTPDTVVTISDDTTLYAKWQSEIKVDGDVNSDGVLDVDDVKMIQSYLHHKDTFTKETFESADLNGDGKVNVVDLAIMKRSILRKNGD